MAAPTYDNAAAAYSAANVASLTTASWAIAGNYLVAGISSGAGTAVDPSGMKWGGSGGTAMTKNGSTLTGGPNVKTSAYGLLSPTIQTSTLYGSWGSNQDETCIGGVSVSGVDTGTPTGTTTTATGTTTTPTVTATTVADDFVVDVVWFGDRSGSSRTMTVGVGQVSRNQIDGGLLSPYEAFAMSTEVATLTSTTMSWEISGSVDWWGIFAIPLKPSAGGAAPKFLPEMFQFPSYMGSM